MNFDGRQPTDTRTAPPGPKPIKSGVSKKRRTKKVKKTPQPEEGPKPLKGVRGTVDPETPVYKTVLRWVIIALLSFAVYKSIKQALQ